jgi:hypothetical protein
MRPTYLMLAMFLFAACATTQTQVGYSAGINAAGGGVISRVGISQWDVCTKLP